MRVEDERLDARGIETDGFELRAGRARPDDILRSWRNAERLQEQQLFLSELGQSRRDNANCAWTTFESYRDAIV